MIVGAGLVPAQVDDHKGRPYVIWNGLKTRVTFRDYLT
jgi:hypothetical protein